MLGLSWLMVSDVRYPSFKKVDLRTRGSFGAIIVGALVLVATVKYFYVMPVVLFSSYLLYGLIRPLISRRLRREIESTVDEDLDDDEESEDTTPLSPS